MVSEEIMVRLFLNSYLSSEFFISLVILYCPLSGERPLRNNSKHIYNKVIALLVSV